MTFLTPFIAALALASPSPPADCSVAPAPPSAQRVFTNADLERMTACRYQTGAQSQVGAPPPETVNPWPRKTARATPEDTVRLEILEADWRARWRSTDQRVRKLRREALGLRQEAAQVRRDARKPPTGRRSPSILISRAKELEVEAKELEDEFQDRARREGALPGWLRPKAR